MEGLLIPAYIIACMFGGAVVSKGLAVSVVTAIGYLAVWPDETKASFIFMFYIPALLLAAFRD